MNEANYNEDATSMVEQAKDKAQETFETAREQTREAVVRGQRYVRENPVPAIVGAFALGAFVGILLSHREKESVRERYWDEPVSASRDWFSSLCSSVAGALRGPYEATRSSVEHAARELGAHAEPAVKHARRTGRKLGFW
ncbi:MAG: hypothetical protein M3463_07960 [Verrucomicrobiota bacterium]|nr:hypothetical protein [Verrucomicrobiota bacterium]